MIIEMIVRDVTTIGTEEGATMDKTKTTMGIKTEIIRTVLVQNKNGQYLVQEANRGQMLNKQITISSTAKMLNLY